MERLQSIFTAHSLRLTAPRRAVFSVLEATDSPLFISDVLAACRGVDRVSVYRTLELFARLGIIEIITTGFKKRYELAEPFKPHHHHLQCISCGELIAIHSTSIESLVTSVAEKHHYIVTDHHFELHGVCSKCRKKPGTSGI